jgi:hypothetical protein
LEWKARWALVEQREREELQKQSPDEKFRALAYLMASADLFDLRALDAEDEVVRARWARLQRLMLGGASAPPIVTREADTDS